MAGVSAAAISVALAQLACGAPTTWQLTPVRSVPRREAPAWFTEACRQLGCGPAVSRWPATRAVVLALAVLATAAWGIAAVAVVGAGCASVPPLATAALRRRRLDERDRQLPDAIERIAASLRSGTQLGPALTEVAGQLDPPLGDDLRATVQGLAHGEAVPHALARWAGRPDASPDLVLAASALGLGAAAGGQVARAVDGVAATLRERRQLHAEARALATQARTSAWLLASAPIAFAAIVATIEPGVLRFLLATPIGLMCLALGALLDALGTSWMARIVRSAR